MPKYTLPDLEYDFSALEPHISGRIVQLHHGQHHAGYVKNANLALDGLSEARQKDDFSRISAFERALAFHLSGHILHSLFWKNLKPGASGQPSGSLAKAIQQDFGGFPRFRQQMNEVAGSIMGSGWAALVYEVNAGCLMITQVFDHQSNIAQGGVPLMVIDAWEHAYYLQYQTDKIAYFKGLWNLWNWKDVGARYDAARQLHADLYGAKAA